MRRWRLTLCAIAVCAAALCLPATATAARPLQTGIFDPNTFAAADAKLAFARTRAAGATSVRLALYWSTVAPGGSVKPAFDAANPADPAYRWGAFDAQVRLARAYGLDPTVVFSTPPLWAQQGSEKEPNLRPSPAELRDFTFAAATRYSGHFEDLPRVRYWSAWNEPNLEQFLRPQLDAAGALAGPAVYRDLLNAAADGIKSAVGSDMVIVGDLDPFAATSAAGLAVSQIRFMRDLLCVSSGRRPHATCATKLRFDIWADHPYTTGGPQHKAAPGNVSLGDLEHVHAMVDAAARAGHVVGRRQVGYWATEFSWDSNPPDPGAVPERLRARWVAEALYRMWRDRITHVDWFQLRDQADTGEPDFQQFQSGLYLRGPTLAADRPKLTLRAFRMPFVAFRSGAAVRVWGRTPGGRPGVVTVTQRAGGRDRVLGRLKAGRGGVFQGRLARIGGGAVGARAANGSPAVAFKLEPTPDIPYNPFGNLPG